MADASILASVKNVLGNTGTYQDGALNVYIDEVIAYMIDGGVPESVAKSTASAGVIALGVTDLQYRGGKLSEYFYQRLSQLSPDAVNTEIEFLKKEIETRQSEIEVLQKRVFDLEAEKEANLKTIAELQAEVSEKQARIEELEALLEVLNEALDDINSAICEVSGKEKVYEPSEMGEAIRNLEYLKYITTLRETFANSVFPDDMRDIKIYALSLQSNSNNLYATFNNSNIRSIKLYIPDGIIAKSSWGMFHTCPDLERIEFLNGIVTEIANYMFIDNLSLKDILGELNVSGATMNGMFQGCNLLENVRFVKNTITYNVSFQNSLLLSDESIQSIIDGLVDLTGATQQTITFHTDIVVKLTTEQLESIFTKNWLLG